MAQIEFVEAILEDFERIFEHIAQFDVGSAPLRIDEITQAVQVLSNSPLIGRPARNAMRELVIGRGSRGYVALYRYVPEIDTVFVLAIRGQRESGYKHDV